MIRDRYEILEVVAEGGQGEVLHARDSLHDRPVAIKVRPGGDQVLSEAKLLLGLKPHPGLPLVREDFFEGDHYYLVMDWVEGATLASRLHDPATIEDVLGWLDDVAGALDHLHAAGVVHRDVTPSNCIVEPGGRAVLVDLGIADAGDAHNRSGTKGYAAPEIVLGHPVGPAADVYGLAATAYALLTGGAPRAGVAPVWRDLPRPRVALIDAALRRALSVDPERRQRSASELVAAMRSDRGLPTNLPAQLTTFVGRVDERQEVARLLAEARLVTLAGPGGIGKTRLAVSVASEQLTNFTDGVWMVELGPIADPALVPAAVAAALGVRERAGEELIDTLFDHLMMRSTLLVLDNCEHLVDACAAFVRALTRTCRDCVVVVTTREPLGVGGEVVLRVPPLSVQGDAISLFMDRARLVHPSFAASAAVGEICERLDGIPLAIELAAARCNMLGAEEIAARLQDRFRLLTGGKTSTTDRQRSLREVIDWSYELLSETERDAFERLSVFAGGWTLDAAEDVGVPLDVLGALVDKSLVVAGVRYTMLETIRAYARERLVASEAESSSLDRHADHFTGLAERAEPFLEGAQQAEWLDRLEDEHDNFRSAIRAGGERSLRIAAALWRFWDTRGFLSEGRSALESALEQSPDSPARSRGLRAAGVLAREQGDIETAERYLGEALELARDAGDRYTIASCMNALAIAAGWRGDPSTETALYEQALPIWREIDNDRGIAVTLGNLGTAAYERGDLDGADVLLQESLALRQRIDDRQGIALALNSLALVAGARGDYELQRELHAEYLAIWRELGYRRGIAVALLNAGTAAVSRGGYDDARPLLDEAIVELRDMGLRPDLAEALHALALVTRATGGDASVMLGESLLLRERLGDKRGIADCLEAIAGIRVDEGFFQDAAELFGAAGTIRESIDAHVPALTAATVEADVARVRDALGDPFDDAWIAGRSMSFEAAIEKGRGPASGQAGPPLR